MTRPENTADARTRPENTADARTRPENTADARTRPENTVDAGTRPEAAGGATTHQGLRLEGLRLEGLALHAGDFTLPDLSLEIELGEYLVLLGPTGAGKTLLLETLAGLRGPDAGRLLWRGDDLTHVPPERRPFAVLFSHLGLFPHLDVLDNIAYGPRVAGVDRASRQAHARRLADQVGISHLLERSVVGLSSGEAQRVALARALAVDPEVLLLDEPLSALDRATRERLVDLLQRLHRETGVTVLHVTHDQEMALCLADRVAVLLDGRLRPPTLAETLFRRPEELAVARFLGLRNVLEAECARGQARLQGLTLKSAGIPASAGALWIPPDRVRIPRLPPGPDDDAPTLPREAASASEETGPVAWEGPARLEAVRLLGPAMEARLRIVGDLGEAGREGDAADDAGEAGREGGAADDAGEVRTEDDAGVLLFAHLPPAHLEALRARIGRTCTVRIPAEAILPLIR